VAIKTLRNDLRFDELTARLRREAQLLAQLNHPNIVQLFDIIDHEGQLALVMEYVEGQNLHIAMREGRGNQGDHLRWLSEVAAAIACAHRAGIVHRDLKAENVLISKDAIAKVTDFGIAEAVADKSGPQQDIAALGALAVQLLGDPAHYSPGLRHLVEGLLDKRPAKRPQAAAAAEAFRLAWHESTQEDTHLPTATAAATGIGGRRMIVGLALIALASGLAGGWYLRTPTRSYVAVLEPEITAPGTLADQQRVALQSTVLQALQQGVLDNPPLTLISQRETRALQGTATELARALGADEILASTLRCADQSCALDIERIAASGAVLAKRNTTLLAEAAQDSWNVVRSQWEYLYPGSGSAEELGELISEADYNQYLELYQQAFLGKGASEQSIFSSAEKLIGRADRFLPLYRLYIDSALDLYDTTRDTSYLARAKRVLDNARTWAGDSPLLYQGLFEVALEQGDFEGTQSAIEKLRKLGTDRILVHTLSARNYSEQSQFEKAASHYRQAIAVRPSRDLYYHSAWNFTEWGRPAEAEKVLQRSLALYPGDPNAHNLLGLILLHAGNIDDAIEHFRASLFLEDDLDARSNLGLAYMLKGDYRDARDEFLAIYEANGRDPVTLINLGDAETMLGNQEAADRIYREVVSGQTRSSVITDPRALSQAYAQLGMHEQAIATLKLGEQNRRRNSEDNFNAALVYTLAGQDIAAMVEVEQALANDFSAIWFTLPFFDSLCADPAFDNLLGQAGIQDHCEQRPGSARLDYTRPILPPGSADE
jgi:serine/threonine-protein kinase